MLINDASITGSLIVNASSSFQNIAVSGNILPGTNNVYNLGSVDKFFKEIFVSTGSINFVDNTGIKTTISSVAGGGIQIGSVQITTSSISFVDITGSVTQTIAQSSSLGSTSNFTPTASFNEYTQSFSSSVSTSFSSSAASVTSLSSSVSASITSLSSSLTSVTTAQNTRLTTIESVTGSYETNGRGIVSGSSQITYTNISSIPSGIISSSAQLENANITNLTITNLTTVNQTASVLFTSGSNRFGDFGDDTHSFTGSVKISGSFTLVGASTATSYNGTINATNGVVSGSSQVDLTTTTNYASGILTRLNTVGVVSGSKTISGITLGSNLATLTIGTGLSGTSYNGSTAVTIANTITNNNQLTNGAGYITSAGSAAAINQTIAAGSEGNLVFATIGTNDFFRIRGGGASNAGFIEIATADDGTEPIYLRQYTGEFASITRTATLLDGSGNTSFPGTIAASNLSGTNTGDQTTISGNAGSATTLVNNSSVTGMNFSGVFALAGSGASTGNSTGARLSESYGAVWNMGNSSTWHHQVINGSSLVGISAAGTNFGSGNIYASGDVTAYYSDMRLKTKISNIDNALDKVMKLNGFYYVNNDIAKEYGYTSDKVQIGVSAQEIEAVLPEIVTLAPFDITGDDEGNALSKSGEHYKTVKYDKIVPLLIEAIKEQQIKIDNLTIEVENLKKPKGL